MPVFERGEYKISVCSVCGAKVPTVGYLCNHIQMREAEPVVIEVVPKQRLAGAVEDRDRLRNAIAEALALRGHPTGDARSVLRSAYLASVGGQ